MADSVLIFIGAHNVYYVKYNITNRTVPVSESFPAVLVFRTALVFTHTQRDAFW
ncbi:protein of unknown function [Citrobacter amalonaticus]|uniref:Uncharacterized protein n=1 Tax=Citrobacter amalonaticus TaxID=35703 RepID=A0AAX2BMB8_CITAM|nr:protein of unknown function [Citrobacter amalonaticus]SAZ99458.1 protein of unknown function [Citrobacter amalonaticus]